MHGLPIFFQHTAFFWDPPQLLLLARALYWATSQLSHFLAFFLLASINKETAILLALVCSLTYRHELLRGDRPYGQDKVLAVAVYAVARLVIALVFGNNPGTIVEFHFLDHNLQFLTNAWALVDLLTLASLAFLIGYRWRKKALFLRTALLCTLLPFLAFSLPFGYLDEWRGYYEAYPILLALGTDTLLRLREIL